MRTLPHFLRMNLMKSPQTAENYDVYVLMQFDYPAIDLHSLEGLSVEERRDTEKTTTKPETNRQLPSLV